MDKQLTISEHLEEFRKRLIRMLMAIGVTTIFVLTFHAKPFSYNGISFFYPFPDPFNNIAAQITVLMKHDMLPQGVQLIQTAPGQALYAQFYVAILVGIVVAMPIIVKEFISFLGPALGKNETQIIRSITIPAIGLFITGCIFSYFIATPYFLQFLYKYGEASGIISFLNVTDFISFVLQFVLAFGVAFQLPVIMYAMSASGIVDEKFWRKNLRYAIVIMVIIGAIITPDGSGVTMWFISGPMIGLYIAGMTYLKYREKHIATLKS